MRKDRLNQAVKVRKDDTQYALQTMYDALNQGQQKKMLKDEKVKALFDQYNVKTEG